MREQENFFDEISKLGPEAKWRQNSDADNGAGEGDGMLHKRKKPEEGSGLAKFVDSKKPKKNMSAYAFFSQDFREIIKERYP